jgi:hypothetical protein
MSFIISSGLRDYMLTSGSFKAGMDGGCIRVYAGTVPATADAAIGSASLLCVVTLSGGGTGITFESTPVGGSVVKKTTETWTGTNVASGTPSFFRHESLSDDGSASTTLKRVQGTIGTSGNVMNISNSPVTSGSAFPVTYCSYGLATS